MHTSAVMHSCICLEPAMTMQIPPARAIGRMSQASQILSPMHLDHQTRTLERHGPEPDLDKRYESITAKVQPGRSFIASHHAACSASVISSPSSLLAPWYSILARISNPLVAFSCLSPPGCEAMQLWARVRARVMIRSPPSFHTSCLHLQNQCQCGDLKMYRMFHKPHVLHMSIAF